MGLTCEVSTSNREDYQLLREEHLRPFGRVRILRDTRLNRYLATKEIHLGGTHADGHIAAEMRMHSTLSVKFFAIL